jgi:predicted ferric reductase
VVTVTAAARRSNQSRRTDPPRWWRDAAGVLAALTLLVVVALWVRGRGIQDLFGPGGDAADAVGRLTGLVSADLLLLQVFLMARVPFVERAFGQDTLARWHRITGFTSFWLMVAHVVLITVGYAQDDRANLVREGVHLVKDYPGMLLAAAGTALLCAVVVLSVREARRRLRYESWHLLHLYAYLGIGLALPHELWTGADFVSSPLARAYWWALYGVCAGSVVLFRLGLPLWRSQRHDLRVRKVRREAPGVFSVYVAGRDLDRLPVRAGQFFAWRFLTGRGWMRAHPYSLSLPPRHDQLRITVRAGGDDADRIARARPGTRVLVEGPFGRLTGTVRRRAGVLLMAAGIGVTPLRGLLEELDYRPGAATLLYRANTPGDFALRAELDAIADRRGALVHYLDGPPPARRSFLPRELAARMSDVDALRRIAPDVADRDVYLCGPAPWMDAVRDALWQAGVPDRQVHVEDFSW